MDDSQQNLTIGEVAVRTGLSVDTLRFYEREGILARPVRRGASGRRVYAEQDVDWLGLCIVLRSSGMPIPAIRRYTELAREGDGTAADRLALLREHRAVVLERIAELHRCLDLVDHKVAVYEDYLEDAAAEPGSVHESLEQVEQGVPLGFGQP